MKTENFKEFAIGIAGLSETYTPNREVSKEKTELYFAALADWSIEQFKQACLNLINLRPDNVFPIFPTPAEIRRYLNAVPKDDILEAWLYLLSLASTHGHAMSLILKDPVLMSTVEAMGTWPDFTFTPYDQLTWKQKEFERLYPLMAKRDKHPAYLQGAYDAKHNMIDLRTGKQLLPEEAEKVILEGKEVSSIPELIEPLTDKKLKG